MRAVLIAKDLAIGAGTSSANVSDINSLTNGAISIYGTNGLKLNTTTLLGTTYPNEPVTIHVGSLGTEAMAKSSIIDRANVEYSYIESKNAVAKIMNIGNDVNAGTTYSLNLPAAITVGDEMGVIINDPSKVNRVDISKEVHYVIAETTDTYLTLLAKLIAKINSDSSLVSAVGTVTGGVVTGIKFTGLVSGKNYDIVPIGVIVDADVTEYQLVNGVFTSGYTTNATAISVGSGTYAQVLDLELMGNAEDGRLDTSSDGQRIWSETSKVDPSKSYDLHKFTWTDSRKGVTSMKTNYENHLTIAMPRGANSTAAAVIFASL